jgi:hypothetical protein
MCFSFFWTINVFIKYLYPVILFSIWILFNFIFWWSQELYHELHALDRFAQDYQHKRDEEDNPSAAHSGK